MSSSVPLVAFTAVRPFVDVLRINNRDVGAVLLSVGLPDQPCEEELMVPVQAWYNFAEAVASELGDHHAGFKIGFYQSIASMAHGQHLKFSGATLGEILNMMIVDFRRVGNYATYKLTTDGYWATIEAKRNFKPSSRPVQIDAFSMGHMVQLVSHFAGKNWNSRKFRATVVAPDAIPLATLPRSSLSRASSKGASIRFPASWLLYCETGYRRLGQVTEKAGTGGFLLDIRRVIELHISDPSLTTEKFAEHVSKSPAALRRMLRSSGTSFKSELDVLRCKRARELLRASDKSIGSVGVEVGYPNSSSFARAFRKWSGMTPSVCREGD
jgi:AraC-like DNA-binding protein